MVSTPKWPASWSPTKKVPTAPQMATSGVTTAIGLGGGAKAIIELFNDGTDTKGMGMLRMDF